MGITACTNCVLVIFGDSSLKFSSFRFVRDGGGHPGFFPITGPLNTGEDYPVIATLDGDFGSTKFQLRSLGGEVIRDINMQAGSGEEVWRLKILSLAQSKFPRKLPDLRLWE